jgi:uncharacterized protein (TIGR04255 family)
MTNRSLPDFDNPPLTEVALSVQFESLEQLRTPQIGLLWAEFRTRFPITQEHAPLDPVVERFGIPRTGTPEVRLQMLESPPLPRVWFVNSTGTELIQVQKDRFIHNWRKSGEGDKYPRYEPIRDTFRSELETFRTVLAREQLGDLAINQCEVTYVNHIVAGDGWKAHGELGNVLTVFRPVYSDDNLAEPEDVRLGMRYVLRDEKNEPIGRLHVSAQPVFRRSDNQPMLMLTLTARSRPVGDNLDDAIRYLDFSRDAIVRAFASITTPDMHKIWGRKDG